MKKEMENITLKEKYKLSVFCHVLTRGDEALVCHTGNGMNIKIPLVCWEVVDKYLRHYTPYEICEAADEEDKSYFRDIFEWLIEKKLIVQENDEKLETVDMVITNRCNLQCTHCCASAETAAGDDPLSTEEWLEIIDKVLEANPKEITITGGEPMLREDFWIITSYIRERYQGKIGLMTNGLLITSQNVKRLISTYHSISISLDGYDEETCSKIRGKGVFDKVLNVVQLLKSSGFPSKKISLSMVETAVTYGETDKFTKICSELGVNCMIRHFSPIGRGAENSNLLKVDIIEKSREEVENIKSIMSKQNVLRPMCQNCRAGRTRLFINHRGDIFPCMLLDKNEYCLGNARCTDDLNAFTKRGGKCMGIHRFHNVFAAKNNKCSECDVSAFCIYCLAEFERIMENENFEVYCEQRKEILSYIWKV